MLRTVNYLMHSGAFWMLVSSLLFATLNVCVKLGASEFSTTELVFYRCVIGLVVVVSWIWIRGDGFATPVPGRQMARAVAGTLALSMNFYALARLPLGTATTLNYTSPLFLALFTTIWLRERPTVRQVSAIIVGFVGVVLLLQPTLQRDQWLAGLVGLGSGFSAGFSYLNVRKLGELGEPESRVVFYFTALATIISGGAMVFGRLHPVTWHNVWIIVAMGVSATLAQLALTRAYRKGRTLVVASLAYNTVLCATVFGMVMWGDHIAASSWLAMAIIAASGIWATRSKS